MKILSYLALTFVICELNFVESFGIRLTRSTTETCNQTQSDGNFLKEIFIGRCYYFYNILQKDECHIVGKNYNCTKIWLKFEQIMMKSACNVSDFDELFKLTDHDIPENKSVFWSGTYTPAHQCKFHFFKLKMKYIKFSLKTRKYINIGHWKIHSMDTYSMI